MKKHVLVLGMITCIFGLTACGTETEKVKEETILTEEQAVEVGESLVEQIVSIYESGTVAQYSGSTGFEMLEAAITSMESASEDMGSYVGIIGSEAEVDADGAVINVTVEGTKRNAVVEVILGETTTESITTNVTYTFGELMKKAALNTLLGMGTVFVVLILICLIISCFRFIYIFENKKKKDENIQETKEIKEIKETAESNAVSAEEDVTDDLELVAVISAAIAASEGAVSTDGFVVRSIRKVNKSKWQKA